MGFVAFGKYPADRMYLADRLDGNKSKPSCAT